MFLTIVTIINTALLPRFKKIGVTNPKNVFVEEQKDFDIVG